MPLVWDSDFALLALAIVELRDYGQRLDFVDKGHAVKLTATGRCLQRFELWVDC